MALISLSKAQLAYGHFALLDHADFSLEPHERVGVIGRNGAGKSSLLKIIAGLQQTDDGLITRQQGVICSYVAQETDFQSFKTIREAVSAGLATDLAHWAEYQALSEKLAQCPERQSEWIDRLHALQIELDAREGWSLEVRVTTLLSRLGLDGDSLLSNLSGGMLKRVALAQALVMAPQVLLLDEPTNHLDMAAIAWLEALLLEFKGSVVFITHDRAFLDRVATRIVELDRGRLLSFPGNFTTYQQRKAELLANEAVEHAKFDKVLAQEEVWIRKGVEARRTRSVGRVARLHAMREERLQRRSVQGQVRLDIAQADRSGKVIAELIDVNHCFTNRKIVSNFNATLLRGDKIGIIGPNGAGKTTLLKLILGELKPDNGVIRSGANLQIAYFDQMRTQLDLDKTLADTISPGSEWVEINGARKHVMSYLGDFLFPAARANSPVRSLSGGERNRLLLARLFARPANVLVLDEPTNDLDIDTLELLEELLQDYPGTVFLVSHDRAFLDNVVTTVIASESALAEGQWREYVGGFSDWVRQAPVSAQHWTKPEQAFGGLRVTIEPALAQKSDKPIAAKPKNSNKSVKLSYKEQRELESLPAQIEALEKEQKEIDAVLADGTIFGTDSRRAQTLSLRHGQIELELLTALERWDELENKINNKS